MHLTSVPAHCKALCIIKEYSIKCDIYISLLTDTQCTDDRPFNLVNEPVYASGPYNYTQRVEMFCSLAGGAFNFTKYRFCTYNRASNRYELQGSPHECGGMLILAH